MKKLIIVSVAFLSIALLAGQSLAAQSITFSKHNLSSSSGNTVRATGGTSAAEICVFCHTPHYSEAASPQTAPLWNHANTTQSFQMYTSSTATLPNRASSPSTISKACLSCHDGATAINSLLNNAGSGVGTNPTMTGTGAGNTMPAGPTDLGTDLRTSHPISFQYLSTHPDVTGGELFNPDTTNTTGWLGGNGTITVKALFAGYLECASCHEPHHNDNTMFLRKSNSGSALCLTCHNK